MTTPWPLPTNVTNPADVFIYPSQLIGEFWGLMVLSLIFMITLVFLYESPRVDNIQEAAVGSFFITSVIGTLAATMGLVTPDLATIFIILTGVIAMVMFLSRR